MSDFKRVPEPQIMDDPAQVAAYVQSVRELQLIAPTHEVLMARAARVIPPHARVLDLGCGPGDPIVQLLIRRPDLQAAAVDLSDDMLASAHQHATSQGVIDRLDLVNDNMTTLSSVATGSYDAVIATLSLHHLPTIEDLHAVTQQIGRVLRPGGAIFLADFAKLPRLAWLDRFADRDADIQSDLYRRDFYNSMRAAWTSQELCDACASLPVRARQITTPLLPFLQIVSTPAVPGVNAHRYDGLTSTRAKRTRRSLDLWLKLAAARARNVGSPQPATRAA